MAELVLQDLLKIYPFTKVKGFFGGRKKAEEALLRERNSPHTTNEGVIAVQQFNLEIEHGEFVVLLGPSGCGKTTVLRMIAGLEIPSTGEVFLNGVALNGLRPDERDIAMIFQNYALYPNMTVYDNIAYTLKNQHMPRDEISTMVMNIAQLLGLTKLLKRRPKELSGGQQQLVAIGRALVRKPKLFLLDEPFSNLDPSLRAHLRLELKRIHGKLGTTFIYVTHDQAEAFSLGTRIVVMRDGLIEQEGTPRELYNHPKNLFTAAFIGIPSMNLIPSRLSLQNGRWCVQLFGENISLPENRAEIVAADDGRQIILGVRPVHIRLSETGVPAEIESVEPTGTEVILHLQAGGTTVTIVVPSERGPSRFFPHTKVKLNFLPRYFHLFDPKTGLSIC